jgi:hypothetical protein
MDQINKYYEYTNDFIRSAYNITQQDNKEKKEIEELNKKFEEIIKEIEELIKDADDIINDGSICMQLTSYFCNYPKKKNQLLEQIQKLKLEILYNEYLKNKY